MMTTMMAMSEEAEKSNKAAAAFTDNHQQVSSSSTNAIAAIASTQANHKWDPFSYDPTAQTDKLNPTCINRINRDIVQIYNEPLPGIYIEPDANDMTLVQALISGPPDTPYECGFFHFVIRFKSTYPFDPPLVKFMTTSNGRVRMNPNFYKDGKVCLSILGTWNGPQWRSIQNLSSVLLSIQSLMNSKPYHNEPGFEQERTPNAAKLYNRFIEYMTMRVSICENLANQTCTIRSNVHRPMLPKSFHKIIYKSFVDSMDFYEEICKENAHLDGQPLKDVLFHESYGVYEYEKLWTKMQQLKEQFASEYASDGEDEKKMKDYDDNE